MRPRRAALRRVRQPLGLQQCRARVGYSGVTLLAPDGRLLGRVRLPEVCGNICFGGPKRNVLFMAASQSIYARPPRRRARGFPTGWRVGCRAPCRRRKMVYHPGVTSESGGFDAGMEEFGQSRRRRSWIMARSITTVCGACWIA